MNPYIKAEYYKAIRFYFYTVLFIFIFGPFAFVKINHDTPNVVRIMMSVFYVPWIIIMSRGSKIRDWTTKLLSLIVLFSLVAEVKTSIRILVPISLTFLYIIAAMRMAERATDQ